MLRPIEHVDPRLGEAIAAPRARVLTATVTRRVDRWYVCLNIEAADYHPGRRHQARSQHEGRRFVGIDRGLAVFAVVAGSDGVEVCRFAAPRPLARRQRRLRRRSRGVARTQRGSRNRAKRPACSPESTIVLPGSVEASFMRSPASSPRPTAGWRLKTSLWPTSSATSASLEPSPMPLGLSSLVSFDTRRRGSGATWWYASAGFPRPRPVRGVAGSRSRWRWGHGPSAAMVAGWSWTATATPPRISPPGPRQPNWMSPRSRTVKQAAGLPMPLEGKALAIASAVVKPAPVNGEPTLRHPLGPRTPEKGGVRLPR
jgi:hypothetical protein